MAKIKIGIVVDMQHDFVDGALANADAQKIVDGIVKFVNEYDGVIIGTQDTHLGEDSPYYASYNSKQRRMYNNMLESKLPPHCILGTSGHEIVKPILNAIYSKRSPFVVNKITFGYTGWAEFIIRGVLGLDVSNDAWTISEIGDQFIEEITMVGTCTDICVISNALILRALFPNVRIRVISSLCAGLTPAKHEAALEVMRSCMIEVE